MELLLFLFRIESLLEKRKKEKTDDDNFVQSKNVYADFHELSQKDAEHRIFL